MTTNVLVLCTHNSARSVLAEATLNHLARQQRKDVHAYSAGSAPSGRVNPFAIAALQAAGIDTQGTRSKSWDEFAAPDAPRMRIVITVCDSAAAETCPYWPGSPVKVHWGYPDPSLAPEASRAEAFEATRRSMAGRFAKLLALPLETIGDAELERALAEISKA